MMKRVFFLLAMVAAAYSSHGQNAEFFRPYKPTRLRLPSVPLVVNDPYFSVWSPYDELNDGDTRHWTGDEKPLEGLLRVDGKTYRFMGSKERKVLESVVPMADEEAWKGRFTREQPADGWQQEAFDDSGWREGTGAFGTDNNSFIRTPWTEEYSDIWVRRTVDLTEADLQGDLYLMFSHDDAFEIYINGTQAGTGIMSLVEGVKVQLTGDKAGLLHAGKNVIAAHCYNKTGGALVDFGLYRNISKADNTIEQAVQCSVDVLATNTYYTFACGPVELDLVFTAPMLIDNLDLLSTPVNYISYQVRSTDGQAHKVQLYLSATPHQAVNKANQPTVSSTVINRGVNYLKTGTIEQPILAKKGDGICIDWGYFYLPDFNGRVSLASDLDSRDTFVATGQLPQSKPEIVCRKASEMPALAYVHDFGTTRQAASYALIGYDEILDIEYMYKRYKGYWARNGKTIFEAFNDLNSNYADIMQRCRQLDQRIYDDGVKAGNVKYAEILSASYRHVIAAHKLFEDEDGNLLFFSKENNSNGCVNTVDLTYPEAPLFLVYNPELQKAMMISIFEYSYTGRWTKPFAAHDLGTYPIANYQVYGGDMPLEEAGNMITLAATLCKLDGNTKYVDKYWDIMKTWTDYLVENGQDPSNQLCTDDFAGHWAHNCNLSIKAIMGVAGFAEMAKMKGDQATYDQYMGKAREMAVKWEQDAREGDHYRLAFDREN
ncbi:MAG: DUF4965 domain-containing protein, partial [Prevotella sp.]|nr:DUF4965 domain-containing protein [Prevotella sp.]